MIAKFVVYLITTVKPGQNKKGQKNFQLHRFLNTFLQQAAEKKYSKYGAAGNFFGPSYFVTALVHPVRPTSSVVMSPVIRSDDPQTC